jgi:DNA-binding transcriptional MerR regulator/methylmalonyl-CoA mutase cobalamin-binding subunit
VGHPIAVVAKRTGLSRDVIRMWERRYAAVEPDRTPAGQRLYSDAQVNRVRLLAAATRGGRSIKTVATLPTADLERLVAEDQAQQVPVAATANGSGQRELVAAALAHARVLDGSSLNRELQRSLAMHGIPTLLEDFVPALMHRIGDEWHAGRLTIAQEHLASATVLAIVLKTLRSIPEVPGAPRLLVTTPSGELHAVGAALAAATAALDGWTVTYLGVDVPAAEIVAAAAGRVDAVALSVVFTNNPAATVRELHGVRAGLPPDIPLIAGGPAAVRMADAIAQPGLVVCANMTDLRRELARVMRAT